AVLDADVEGLRVVVAGHDHGDVGDDLVELAHGDSFVGVNWVKPRVQGASWVRGPKTAARSAASLSLRTSSRTAVAASSERRPDTLSVNLRPSSSALSGRAGPPRLVRTSSTRVSPSVVVTVTMAGNWWG